ncbi:MAG: methyltransferase domain-containing protein [Deltaproteobacteria bacterium]|nr:methyltransferase domain-containing protein [Deltaproteobacteria bacterium]
MSDARWNADDYARHSEVQRGWAEELISKLALRGTERILDLGCGDGKMTAELAARVPWGRVVGIDNSAEMIALARERFPTEHHSNLWFHEADARALPFEGEVDVVFSSAALHWVLDHRPVLAGIRRALVPGGLALLQMGGRGNAGEVVAAADRLLAEPAWAPSFGEFSFPYGFYGPEEYAPWLAEAGLAAVRVELIPKEAIHSNRETFEGWIRTTWLPYTERVPEDRRSAFVSALAGAYLARHPADAEGRCAVRMVRLEVEAVKR